MTPTPSQVQTDAANVIDLENSPEEDIPVKTSPPTETHVTSTQNSNSKTANNDTTNPTQSIVEAYRATYRHALNPIPEIELTQPNFSQPMSTEEEPSAEAVGSGTRPEKLPLKRRATQPHAPAIMDPMQGASAGIARRMSEVIKQIPTPGFKPPRKK
ncbi:hypothetical protein PIB30_107754 [Stylosanthes scabra]|uniref:Uncharacterized protein n=1 Tax=Stylosanthes scabra TaxID=79078 RepID=A0ABU6TYR7_9FABA|nr:hypothetical protein [Stylosanthes scabra]